MKLKLFALVDKTLKQSVAIFSDSTASHMLRTYVPRVIGAGAGQVPFKDAEFYEFAVYDTDDLHVEPLSIRKLDILKEYEFSEEKPVEKESVNPDNLLDDSLVAN